ncbi:hypothetical protein ACPCSP_25700 [Streptomyces cinereoruber]|uniref:hypothetical protein n=1 Tax=Streptomyces cinereoruber TaxID=67260 RepID=UPI003C2BC603
MKGLAWLRGGNDRDLAATHYADRTSATEQAAEARRAKERARRARDADKAGRAGQAWQEADRRRFHG